jgi:hypothetical protein
LFPLARPADAQLSRAVAAGLLVAAAIAARQAPASLTGIAGAQMVAKQIRRADPDLLDDAMNLDQF